MKSYNDIKEELLHHYKECLERHQKALDEAKKNNDFSSVIDNGRNIVVLENSIKNIDEVTKSYIGANVNYFLIDIERESKNIQDDYFNRFDRFSDLVLGNIRHPLVGSSISGIRLGLTKDDLSLFKGKIASLTTTKDEFITYANQHFGTNIPSCEEMMLMDEYKNSNNRDEYIRYAEMRRDSGKLSNAGEVLVATVQDLIDGFDSKHKEQISNKQM